MDLYPMAETAVNFRDYSFYLFSSQWHSTITHQRHESRL